MLVSVLAIYWDDDAPTSALRAADNKHTHEHTRARTHTPNNMYVYNASSVGVSTLYRPQPPHRTGHSTTSKRRYHTCTTCVSWSYIGGTKYMVFQADGYKTNCMWWCSCNYLAHVNYMNTTTCSLLQKNWSSSLHHQSLSCRQHAQIVSNPRLRAYCHRIYVKNAYRSRLTSIADDVQPALNEFSTRVKSD